MLMRTMQRETEEDTHINHKSWQGKQGGDSNILAPWNALILSALLAENQSSILKPNSYIRGTHPAHVFLEQAWTTVTTPSSGTA